MLPFKPFPLTWLLHACVAELERKWQPHIGLYVCDRLLKSNMGRTSSNSPGVKISSDSSASSISVTYVSMEWSGEKNGVMETSPLQELESKRAVYVVV